MPWGERLSFIRKWNIREKISCDWCTHFHRHDCDELCTLIHSEGEPVPFIRTCVEFKRRARKGSGGVDR